MTFTSEDITDVWVVTTEPDENEWRGRASMMQFYDEVIGDHPAVDTVGLLSRGAGFRLRLRALG